MIWNLNVGFLEFLQSETMWTFLFRIPGQHKWFRDDQGRVAPADNSGYTPDETDDGALYFDPQRLMEITEPLPAFSEFDPDIRIILTDKNGKDTLLGGVDRTTVKILNEKFGTPFVIIR